MKATIYTTSEFFGNLVKQEVTLTTVETKKYAQYDKALFVKFIPKGKRKERGFVKTYAPYVVILKGHGYPEPAEIMKLVSDDGEVKVSKSMYSSFDERYKLDADVLLNEVITATNVIVDVRDTKQTNIINL